MGLLGEHDDAPQIGSATSSDCRSLEAMADPDGRPVMGEEPAEGSLNAAHVQLVDFVCEELWSLADDGEGEAAARCNATAERIMCKGATPMHKDVYAWLRAQLPDSIRYSLLRESRRLGWPFVPPDLPEMRRPITPFETAMRTHSEWKMLEVVLRDACTFCDCGKPRKTSHLTGKAAAADQEARKILADDLVREVGELCFNDALLRASEVLRCSVTTIIHEWDSEIQWQKEWGGGGDWPAKRKESGSSSQACTTQPAAKKGRSGEKQNADKSY